MKNVIEKGSFWGPMALTLVILALLHLMGGVSLTPILIGIEWIFLIAVFCLFRTLRKEEVNAMYHSAAAFVKAHYIKLPDTDNSRFNAIVGMSKPYLVITKFKWGIGLFLLLATISYLFRSVNTSFVHPLFGEINVINFYTLASIFAGIVFGSIILVMWLATKLPRICYKKADFYVMPRGVKGEEGKGIEVAKNAARVTARTGIMTIVRDPKGYFLTKNDLLILPEDNYISPGERVFGRILYFREEPVLPYMELEEGEVKKDFKEEKPIVIC